MPKTVSSPDKGGRPPGPTKNTPTTLEVLQDWLEDGCTRKAACAAAGIHRDTFYDWFEHLAGFSDMVLACEAVAERRWIILAQAEKPGHSIKLLERRFREDWGNEITLNANAKVVYDLQVSIAEPDEPTPPTDPPPQTA